MEKIIAVLDIGTNEIRGLVGKKSEGEKITVLARECRQSDGLARGIVLNIDNVARIIKDIALTLEKKCGKRIKSFYVGSGGAYVYTKKNSAYRLLNPKGQFTDQLISELLDENKKLYFENGVEAMKIENLRYLVDQEFEIENPVGVHGAKIEGYYLVFGTRNSDNNALVKSIVKAGYECAGIILAPNAAAQSVLTHEEREVGVAMIDIGAGKTSLVVCHSGKVLLSVVLPLGGYVVTKDIAAGCGISIEKAEKIKTRFGSSVVELQSSDAETTIIELPGTEGRASKEIDIKTLALIIQARMEEIIDNILFQIEQAGLYDKLGAGIVITGGGAKLKDLSRLLSYKTGLEVRIGTPVKNVLSTFEEAFADAVNATLYGLLIEGNEHCLRLDDVSNHPIKQQQIKTRKKDIVNNNNPTLWDKFKGQLDDFFKEEDGKM
jgi:cell division protein FtsA